MWPQCGVQNRFAPVEASASEADTLGQTASALSLSFFASPLAQMANRVYHRRRRNLRNPILVFAAFFNFWIFVAPLGLLFLGVGVGGGEVTLSAALACTPCQTVWRCSCVIH